MKTVEQFIIASIKTILPDNAARTITPDMDLMTDLGADLLSLVSLIFSIDEEFHVGTDALGELVLDCRTVGELVAATERLRQTKDR